MQRRSNKYVTGLPQVGVEFILNPHIPAPPPPPPPPSPEYLISGTVYNDIYGGTGFSAPVAFSGFLYSGTVVSASSGSYGVLVPYSYSGNAVPSFAGVGTFNPVSRNYTFITGNQPNQDYAYETPAFALNGTVWVVDFFSGGSVAAFNAAVEINGGTVYTDPNGIYGTTVYKNDSYSILPHYADGDLTPTSYSGVATADVSGLDFYNNRTPALVSGEVRVNGSPAGGVAVAFAGDGQGVSDGAGTYVGTLYVGYTGTAFLPFPLPPGFTVTPTSRVFTLTGDLNGQDFDITGAPSGPFLISGSIFDARYGGTGFSTPVEFTGSGVITSSASGSYGLLVESGYSGMATPYIEYYCPIPGADVNIPLPVGNNASRNVIDPVNNLLWIIDESAGSVYYVNVLTGAYAGLVTVAGAPNGFTAISYDPVSEKVVCTAYSGSLVFIEPVSKAVSYANFTQATPGYHMLAIDDSGTVYVADNRNTAGNVYAVDCATETLLGSYSLTPNNVYTDSICWASNIGKLVVNQSVFGDPRFFLFNPVSGFEASVMLSTAPANYDNYYIRSTGHVLMSFSGTERCDIIDISQGTNATQVLVLDGPLYAPYRAADACEDTCNQRLFISEGEWDMYEFSTDPSHLYVEVNSFTNGGAFDVTPIGLAHSRRTNLVYWEDYGGSPIPVRSIQFTGSNVPVVDMVSQAFPYPQGNSVGYYTFASGNGSYWSAEHSSTAEPGFNSYGIFETLTPINVGADYPVTVTVVYTGSGYIFGRGGGGVSDTDYISIDLNGVSPASMAVYDASGSFGGTLVYDGTVGWGANAFNFSFQNFAGQENNNPHYLYCTMTAITEIRPLGSAGTTPVVLTGTWNPPSRTYVSVGANQTNQDFSLWEVFPPSGECPIPGADITPIVLTDPLNNFDRINGGVLATVNMTYWAMDDNIESLYYVDVASGTYGGGVAVGTVAFNGVQNLVYDYKNSQVVCETDSGNIVFVDPTNLNVSYTVFTGGRKPLYQESIEFDMLAVDQNGTTYFVAGDGNASGGQIWVVDGATHTELSRFDLAALGLTDGLGHSKVAGVCWHAGGLNRLVLTTAGGTGPLYWLFDPSTGSITPSAVTDVAGWYHVPFYVSTTNQVMIAHHTSGGIDVWNMNADGTGTIAATLAQTWIDSVTEDTCWPALFFSNTNDIYQYTLDGSWTMMTFYTTAQSTGVAHSRRTNLVYYTNWSTYEVMSIHYSPPT